MRFESAEHPGKTALLAWAEGELPWWRSRMVGRHVRSCWQCKAQVNELEALVCAAGLRVDQLPEPSAVETAKAWWRFREVCVEIDPAPQARRLRLRAPWAITAAIALATAALAYVTTQRHFSTPEVKRVSFPRPAHKPRPAAVPPEARVEGWRPTRAPKRPLPPEKASETAVYLGPAEEDLLAAEIQALAALHRSRFCLSSGIAVRRAGSVVEISGFVASQDERDRLGGVLSGIGHADILHVRLSGLEESADRTEPTLESAPAGQHIAPPIEVWLREGLKVGSRITEREMFNLMNSVVLASESVSTEAWAIRHLAEQFPPDRTRRLSPELSGQLLQMVDDHAIALGNSLQTLQGHLNFLLGRQPERGGNAAALPPDAPWQNKVLALQQRSEEVVSRLLESFSADAGAAPQADAPEPDFPVLLSRLDEQTKDCTARAGDLRASIQMMPAEAQRGQNRNDAR